MTSLPNVSDEHLVQQFVQGDLLAFDSLYNRHVRTVYGRVRYAVPAMDVEDVVQDIFLAVIGSLANFRGEAQFNTWLNALINHKVIEYYRKCSRKKETMQVDLIEAEECSDQSSMSSLEDLIVLQNALNNLPDQYREVILLRFAVGLQFNDIALCLNKSLESTKSFFRRAMVALKENIEEDAEGNLEENTEVMNGQFTRK
jgi:RNA polymerase sigma-70 factor, ECF subfamily